MRDDVRGQLQRSTLPHSKEAGIPMAIVKRRARARARAKVWSGLSKNRSSTELSVGQNLLRFIDQEDAACLLRDWIISTLAFLRVLANLLMMILMRENDHDASLCLTYRPHLLDGRRDSRRVDRAGTDCGVLDGAQHQAVARDHAGRDCHIPLKKKARKKRAGTGVQFAA